MTTNIETTIGRANTRTAITEMFIFYVPKKGMRGTVEAFLGKAAKDMARFPDCPISQYGTVMVVPSVSNIPEEVGGKTATVSYQIMDGTILKVFAKKRTGWKTPMDSAVLYLRVREGAAKRRIAVPCQESNALASPEFYIKGNFDIIKAEDVVAEGGKVNVLSSTLAGREIDLLNIEVLEPEKEPLKIKSVTMETSKGEKTTISKVQTLRKIKGV